MSLSLYGALNKNQLISVIDIMNSEYKELLGELQEKDRRIAELEKENKELEECFDDCYEDLGKVQHELNKALRSKANE